MNFAGFGLSILLYRSIESFIVRRLDLGQARFRFAGANDVQHPDGIRKIAGFLPTPFDAFYSAAKHALEGYTETLAYEVTPFGIRCVLVEPGFIKTELRGKKAEVVTRLDAYAAARAKAGRSFDEGVGGGIQPEHVANLIARALAAHRPRLRQRIGADAHMLAFIRGFLPGFVFQAGMKSRY